MNRTVLPNYICIAHLVSKRDNVTIGNDEPKGMPGCSDTWHWDTGYGNSYQLLEGYSCGQLWSYDYCDGGKFTNMGAFYAGYEWNYPEENCCECGKYDDHVHDHANSFLLLQEDGSLAYDTKCSTNHVKNESIYIVAKIGT